jgi:tetratricopeptide (TPR) repeat protein
MAIVRQHDLAASLMREGRTQQALAIMKGLVDQEPANPQFLSHYGSLLDMVGQWSEAIPMLERALAAGEHSAATYFNLAEAHARLDHRESSEAYLRLTIAQQPRHVGALLKLAELLEKKGAVEEARGLYEGLLQSWDGEESVRASLKRRLDRLSK